MKHQELGDRLDTEAQDMEEKVEQLDQRIAATRRDWEHKQHDASVPGAEPVGGERESEAQPGSINELAGGSGHPPGNVGGA